MAGTYYISAKSFVQLLDVLKRDFDVFVPVKEKNRRFYRKYGAATHGIVVGEVRSVEPLKSFFFRARECVAKGFGAEPPSSTAKPSCIVGVKACDLKGFTVEDFVFTDSDYRDPFYMKARERNLIVSADCTCAIDTCFCMALDVSPYPQDNFDLNLSTLTGGFVVETGSEKGKAVVDANGTLFEEAKDEMLVERRKQRDRVAAAVEKNIADNAIPLQQTYKGVIERNYESDVWNEEAKTCVECGACNTICPTCHCFLLYDQKDEARMARLRLWDSCMIKDFARVAGGANPRPRLWMRLRNRFEKKFDFFPKVADVFACTGCGRCVSACPAKIDIRNVLRRLVAHA